MKFLTRVLLWGLVLCFPVGATAMERARSTEVGVGVVWDCAHHSERYLALQTGGSSPHSAIEAVNTEAHTPHACMMAMIAFVRGDEVNAVAAPGGRMRVLQITIVAAQTPQGWQPVPRLTQYTAIFEKLDEA
jgi:hypothetical protein